MTQPGSIASLVRPRTQEERLYREISELKRRIGELETAQPQTMASSNFDGTLNPATAGTQGWAVTAAGQAIFNTLTVRSGAIPSTALATSSLATIGFQTASNFNIPAGTGTAHATVTLPIPAGYTQMFVYANVHDYARNSTGFTDWLNSVLVITPPVGAAILASGSSPDAPAGSNTTSYAQIAQQLTGLTSGAVSFASKPAASNATWGANAINATSVSVIGLFVR